MFLGLVLLFCLVCFGTRVFNSVVMPFLGLLVLVLVCLGVLIVVLWVCCFDWFDLFVFLIVLFVLVCLGCLVTYAARLVLVCCLRLLT